MVLPAYPAVLEFLLTAEPLFKVALKFLGVAIPAKAGI